MVRKGSHIADRKRRIGGTIPAACLFLALCGFARMADAQDVRATARVDSNSITIGDQLKLYLEVQHPPNVAVAIPSLADSLEGLEIVKRDTMGVKQAQSSVVQSMTFTITSFDSGLHVVPPLVVTYTSAGDTAKRSVQTSPIPIFVHGIAVDTSKEIKDIKPPLALPITLAELLPYIISVVVLAGLVWLFLYIRKKRKRGESLIPEAPPRPAHEVALEALRSLESEKLWQRGKVKEYHSLLTDIIRMYIERRFKVMAMEMTSDEVLSSPLRSMMTKETTENLKDLLLRADLVKFAKYQPVQSEHEASLAGAFAFVESTSKEKVEHNQQAESVEVQSA